MITLRSAATPVGCTLTTCTGRVLRISFYRSGWVNVYLGWRLGFGSNFANLAEAVAYYKTPDVKEALAALLVIRLEALYDGNPLP